MHKFVLFAVLSLYATSAAAQPASVHDFISVWDRGSTADTAYKPPASGPGPVMNQPGRRALGDDKAAILQPWAGAIVKKYAAAEIAGKPIPLPKEVCTPMGVPHILQMNGLMQMAVGDKISTIMYARDMRARLIYMNAQHPAQLVPSSFGHSVGRWDGDTLVVDTVGLDDRTPVDIYGTPHTAQLHVVERYRIIDGGKTLRVDFTVEDPGAFTTPWSAYVTYTRSSEAYEEVVCQENMRNPDGTNYEVLVAGKPDF